MKKLLSILMTTVILFSLWGCGAKDIQPKPVAALPAENTASEAAASEAAVKAASEAAASEAAVKAASEAAEAEAAAKAASEAAEAEAAAKAASEAAEAEAEAKAASEAAASEAAAKAASEAAAAEAAAKAESEKVTLSPARKLNAGQGKGDKGAGQTADTPEKADAEKAEEKSAKSKAVTGSNFESDIERRLLKLHNEERAAQGLGKLTLNTDLQSAARIRSRELYRSNTFAHQRPNGDSWSTVIKVDIPVAFSTAGENLCMTKYNDPSINYAYDADFYFNNWLESPSHYENIIHPEFDQVGIGVYCIEKNGMVYGYASAIFAKLR